MCHRLSLSEKLIRCFYCGRVFASADAALAEECPRSREGQQREGRIEKELGSVMDRLRQLGGAVVVEEFPGAIDDNSPLADPADRAQATRSLLVERANRLAEALERLRKSQDGICEEGAPVIASSEPGTAPALPPRSG